MADITLKTTFLLRRGTNTEWTTDDPVLLKGEPGFNVDTNILKIGDGTKKWSELEAINGDLSISGDAITIDIGTDHVVRLKGFSAAATNAGLRKTSTGAIEWVELLSKDEITAELLKKQDKLTAGTNITITTDTTTTPSTTTIDAPNNAYTYIKQIDDYLFETQYTNENVDYTWANQYFKSATASDLENSYGACSAVMKDGQVLRQFDYYYDDNVEFIVRKVASPEATNIVTNGVGLHASIGTAAGIKLLTKSLVESGVYHKKFKLVPFDICDGINDAGLYIQQNVVPLENIVYDINPSATTECCVTMLLRFLLDHCASFAEVETALTKVHIYPTTALTYGFHFFVAKGSDWRIIELTASGHKTIGPAGITGVDGTMPLPIMTNFRTTGLSFDADNNVDWASIETHGIGVERFDIATKAFATATARTLEQLRTDLKYSHSYDYDGTVETVSDTIWCTELSGEIQKNTAHVFTVADASTTSGRQLFKENLIDEHNNFSAKTRADGKGCWITVHSAIYDLSAKSFNIAIQERFDTTYDFALDGSTVSSSGTMERDFSTKIDVGYLDAGTAITSDTYIKDVLYNILYKDDSSLVNIYYGALDAIPTSFTGLTAGTAKLNSLISGEYTITITAGDTTTHSAQYVVFAIPHQNAMQEYQIVAWYADGFPYNIPYSHIWLQDASENGYNVYYLDVPSYDQPDGIKYHIKIKSV